MDDPRLPRSNLFPIRDVVKKPRSGATEGKKKDPGQSRVEFKVFLFNRKKEKEKGVWGGAVCTYPTLRGHLLCARLGPVFGGPSKCRVLNRRHTVGAVFATTATRSRDFFADALVHDLEVCVVQQRLEVGAREALRGVGKVTKVDVVRYGDLSRVRL